MRLSKRLRHANPLPPARATLSTRAEQELARLTTPAATPDLATAPMRSAHPSPIGTPPRHPLPSRTPRRLILAGVAATAAVGIGLSWVTLHDIGGGASGQGGVATTEVVVAGESGAAVVAPSEVTPKLPPPVDSAPAPDDKTAETGNPPGRVDAAADGQDWAPSVLVELPDPAGSNEFGFVRFWFNRAATAVDPDKLAAELQPDGTYRLVGPGLPDDQQIRFWRVSPDDDCSEKYSALADIPQTKAHLSEPTDPPGFTSESDPFCIWWDSHGNRDITTTQDGSFAWTVDALMGDYGDDWADHIPDPNDDIKLWGTNTFIADQEADGGFISPIYMLGGIGADREKLKAAMETFVIGPNGGFTQRPDIWAATRLSGADVTLLTED